MVKILNREEFIKCCELMNSVDKESRILGWSLVQDCIEIPENLYIRVITVGFTGEYKLMEYIQERLSFKSNIKQGTLLYDLVFKGKYKYHNQVDIIFKR